MIEEAMCGTSSLGLFYIPCHLVSDHPLSSLMTDCSILVHPFVALRLLSELGDLYRGKLRTAMFSLRVAASSYRS